jgi:hypothetical protein
VIEILSATIMVTMKKKNPSKNGLKHPQQHLSQKPPSFITLALAFE